jgi:Zn finger protein HypA/HybF involved in hydrogenase expression/LEA14-like dessication related protein
MPSKVQAYITKGKQRLKQIGLQSTYARTSGTVYLRNGDTFELELFNGKTTMVMVKIKVNGKYISTSGLVIRPGERVFLERFIDENRKFIFNTYEVANTAESKAAIEDNGDIEIEFYDEVIPLNNAWGGTITYTGNGIFNNQYYNSTGGNPMIGQTTFTSNFSGDVTSVNCSSDINPTLDFMPDMDVQRSTKLSAGKPRSKKSIETGRVEKGDVTNQSFKTVDNQFSIWPFHTSAWKILPVSQKPIMSEDIKMYCTQCGAKIKKSTFKFCPNCGSKLD